MTAALTLAGGPIVATSSTRSQGVSLPPPGHLPANLLKLSARQANVLVVDLARSRLYVFARLDGRLRLMRDRYVSTGRNGAAKRSEGDQRTPVGVYFTTGRISAAELPDQYGTGALPVNYPNEWDLRHGRTGYGIWIHGMPGDSAARAPRASDGCIVLSNNDMSHLWELVGDAETPVIIADGLRWVSPDHMTGRADEVEAAILRWVTDWQGLDHEAYAGHYARELRVDALVRSLGQPTRTSCDGVPRLRSEDRPRLADERLIGTYTRCLRVGIEDFSIFAYPGESDTVMVTFDHDPPGSGLFGPVHMRQFWKLEADGRWRIVFEGPVLPGPDQLRGIPYSARTGFAQLVR